MICYKQGVYGELIPDAAEGLRVTERFYGSKRDVFVTSIRDGSHIPGSFHPHGRAWDMRKNGVTKRKLQAALNRGCGKRKFQVISYKTHFHIEYDPEE